MKKLFLLFPVLIVFFNSCDLPSTKSSMQKNLHTTVSTGDMMDFFYEIKKKCSYCSVNSEKVVYNVSAGDTTYQMSIDVSKETKSLVLSSKAPHLFWIITDDDMDGLVDHGQESELNVIDYFNLTHDARSNGDLKDIEIAQRKFNEIFSILRENFDEEMLHLKTLNVTSAVKSADILDFYNLIQEKGCKNCFVHDYFYAYTFSYRDTVYDIHIESNRGNFRDCAISLSAPQLELLIVDANMDGLIDHSQGTEPSYRGHFSFNEGNERLIYGDVQKFLKVQRKFNSLFFFLRQRLEEEI